MPDMRPGAQPGADGLTDRQRLALGGGVVTGAGLLTAGMLASGDNEKAASYRADVRRVLQRVFA